MIHPHSKAEEALHWGKFPEFLNTQTVLGILGTGAQSGLHLPQGVGVGVGLKDGSPPQPQEHKAEIPQCTLGKMKNEVLVSTPCP